MYLSGLARTYNMEFIKSSLILPATCTSSIHCTLCPRLFESTPKEERTHRFQLKAYQLILVRACFSKEDAKTSSATSMRVPTLGLLTQSIHKEHNAEMVPASPGLKTKTSAATQRKAWRDKHGLQCNGTVEQEARAKNCEQARSQTLDVIV